MTIKTTLLRVLSLLFCIFLLLHIFGCQKGREPKTSETESAAIIYVLNTNSKKIHRFDCGTGARIMKKNRATYQGDLEVLFNKGYTTCGNCF